MVTARNSGGSVTSQFRVTVSPAKLDPSLIQIYEITDRRRPRQGQRRPAAADRWGRHHPNRLRTSLVLAGRVEGGVPPGTLVTPNTTFVRRNGLPVGTINYNVLYWYRQSDGAVFNALPPSGGPPTARRSLRPRQRGRRADHPHHCRPGSGGGRWRHLAVARRRGDRRRIQLRLCELHQQGQRRVEHHPGLNSTWRWPTRASAGPPRRTLSFWRSSTCSWTPAPCRCRAGAPALREASAITFFQLVKLTPRL